MHLLQQVQPDAHSCTINHYTVLCCLQAPGSSMATLLTAWTRSDVGRQDAALVERLALDAAMHYHHAAGSGAQVRYGAVGVVLGLINLTGYCLRMTNLMVYVACMIFACKTLHYTVCTCGSCQVVRRLHTTNSVLLKHR